MRHMSHLTALTRREREIVNALFALGNRATAEAIRARLTDPPSDSSGRATRARRAEGCVGGCDAGAAGEEGLPQASAGRAPLRLLGDHVARRREAVRAAA